MIKFSIVFVTRFSVKTSDAIFFEGKTSLKRVLKGAMCRELFMHEAV